MKAVAVYSFLWMLFLASILIYALFTIGCSNGDRDVEVSVDEQSKAAYYSQLERRVQTFFVSQGLPVPSLPSQVELYSKTRFFEFQSTPDTTCYFHRPDHLRIGDDKWASGCVPHELGHMALFMIGHPCWNDFEHPGGCK